MASQISGGMSIESKGKFVHKMLRRPAPTLITPKKKKK